MTRLFAWHPVVSACTDVAQIPAETGKHTVAVNCIAQHNHNVIPVVFMSTTFVRQAGIFDLQTRLFDADKDWHLFSLDGSEIAAVTTCGNNNYPTCKCPKDRPADTNKTRTGAAARALLDADYAILSTAPGRRQEVVWTRTAADARDRADAD